MTIINLQNVPDEIVAEEIAAIEKEKQRKIKEITFTVTDGEIRMRYFLEPAVPFQRLRRITGYLVGSTEKWNDAKKAELNDRVKHGEREGGE